MANGTNTIVKLYISDPEDSNSRREIPVPLPYSTLEYGRHFPIFSIVKSVHRVDLVSIFAGVTPVADPETSERGGGDKKHEI